MNDNDENIEERNKIGWHYNLYIRIYVSVFMMLILSVLFELSEFNPNSASLYMTGIIAVTVIFTIIFGFIHRRKVKIEDDKLKSRYFEELYNGVKGKSL